MRYLDDSPDAQAERFRLIVDLYKDGSKRAFAERLGLSPTVIANTEKADGQGVSLRVALALFHKYRIPLDFVYLGRRDFLPQKLALALDRREADARAKAETLRPLASPAHKAS